MTDEPDSMLSNSAPPTPPPRAPSHGPLHPYGATLLCAAISVFALAWLIALLLAQGSIQIPWPLQVIAAIGAVITSAWVAVQQYRFWSRPISQLLDLSSQVRQGKAPIEELSQIGGGLSPVVPLLQ